jgi:hypothetical protein
MHQNASPSVVARAHSPLNRLRLNRTRSGRSFSHAATYGGWGGSPFAYPDPPAPGATTAHPPAPGLHEQKLAEKALAYERALQRSVSASMARKMSGPGASDSMPLSESPTAAEKGKAPERTASLTATEPDLQQSEQAGDDHEVHSELGDSYVHGVRTRGPHPDEVPEADEDELGGGVMNMLTQIYTNQRRAVG